MIKRLLLATLLVGSAAGAQPRPATPAGPASQAAQRDWAANVVQTPEGGYRMGNPQAPLKVVEYLSLTCGHCAAFSAQGMPVLTLDHVRTGRVSLEYRNFVLNALDLTAAVLTRCAAPSRYFAMSGTVLAEQEQWVGRFTAAPAAEQQRVQALPPLQALPAIAAMTGLDRIAGRFGMTPQRVRACLSDRANIDRLVAMQQAGGRAGVDGTPAFVVNGRLATGVHDWAALQPLLRPPGG